MKIRLDQYLVNNGLASGRDRAKAMIMAGEVFVNGERCDKAGTSFDENNLSVEVRGKELRYVSRGGLKLEKAMTEFGLKLDGLICADIGASTGGFTDCMLQNGAARVYAVDVGYGQLAWKLREDERVVCVERTNARYLNEEIIPEKIDFFSADVSFISLKLILPAVRSIAADNARGVCLIKPQFEAGREKVGKKGVVREPKTHIEVINNFLTYCSPCFSVSGLSFSPIKGPEGNIEYLAYLGEGDGAQIDVEDTVKKAFETLNGGEFS